jgi:hypothetical protein
MIALARITIAIALLLALMPIIGARAGQGYADGVPCHDFTGKEYDRCAAAVTYCERQFGINPDSPVTPEDGTKMDHCIGARAARADVCADYERAKQALAQCLKTGKDCAEQSDLDWDEKEIAHCKAKPPARVTVTPSPPPLGWIYGPYTVCTEWKSVFWTVECLNEVVNVQADGLNVRMAPNGPPIMALVNGTPFIRLRRQGNWLLIAPACDLTPTWAWSWTANVPLNRCWVYFP